MAVDLHHVRLKDSVGGVLDPEISADGLCQGVQFKHGLKPSDFTIEVLLDDGLEGGNMLFGECKFIGHSTQ